MLRLILLLLLTVASSAQAQMLRRGHASSSYSGPCDVITGGCVEAWSVTRAMLDSYHGPLFQIAKGASPFTTCDVPQNSNRQADPSACIASVCVGAVATGCLWNKIYSQVHPTVNDYQQYTYGQMTSPFTIDATTGLPAFNSSSGTGNAGGFLITSNPGTGDATADLQVTGAPTSGSSRSALMVGRPGGPFVQCCGAFGWDHLASIPPGQPGYYGGDFELAPDYNTPLCLSGHYCWNLDLEQGPDSAHCRPTATLTGVDLGTSIVDLTIISTWEQSSGTFTGWHNGHADFTATDTTLCSPANYSHFSAGGDMSPSPTYFREGLITSTVLSGTDETNVFNNIKAFYPALTFP